MKRYFLKKFLIGLIGACLCLSLCACSLTDTSIDELMRPPQLSQSRQQVQAALQNILGTSYHLIAPTDGEHRSSINLQDLNGDEQNEAICFFTTGEIQLLDVLVLRKEGDAWSQWGRFNSDATKVEQLSFSDMDGDGIKELIVGWSYLTGSEKLMEILRLGEARLSSQYKQKYSLFAPVGSRVVLVEQSAAAATLLGWNNHKITSLSSVPIAPSISSFIAMKVAATTKGKPAIYLDVQTEDRAYHTEVLVINAEQYLENKLLSEEQMYRTRPYGITCADIDGDGVPDLPDTRPMENGDPAAYYTDWYSFDGTVLSEPLVTFTAAGDQFYLVYPEKWMGRVFVRQDAKMQRLYHFIDRRDRIFYSLRVFTATEYSQVYAGEGWIPLSEGTDKVIAYKKGTETDERYALTTVEWTAALHTY